METSVKAIISNKIYMQASNELQEALIDKLTYKIEQRAGVTGGTKIEVIRNYSIPKQGVIAIPSGRMELIPNDYEVEDRRTLLPTEFPIPKIPLREAQVPVYAEWNLEGSGILNAKPGWGKTFTGLHLAYKLKQKTLVIAHNTFLRDQWIGEVKELFGFTPGVISADEYNIDAPVVIGNVQSVTKRALQLADQFGTIVVDECHHTPATTFSGILDLSKARYKLGLSGTIKRKDGKHILFQDYFGSYIAKPPQSDTLDPIVKIVKSPVDLARGKDWATKITDLHQDPEYVGFIAFLAAAMMKNGHRVLVVADRVEFLYQVSEKVGFKLGVIVGETSQDEREEMLQLVMDDKINGIAGSRSIWAEGISCNPLSCIILATPYASEPLIEQLVGRIQRPYPGKLQPIVMDVNFPNSYNQNRQRLSFYFDMGWECEMV